MAWGLRLQLLVLLGVLMVLGFGPLFFATSTYTRVGFQSLQRENAEALARSVAARVSSERDQLPRRRFLDELGTHVQSGAVQAIGVYGPSGRIDARFGEPELVELLSREPEHPSKSSSRLVDTHGGRAIIVYVPDELGGVATVSRIQSVTQRADRLSRLMGLYMAVGALTVLAFAYFALTRWIVRPVLRLAYAADRVAGGSRRIDAMTRAPREIRQLSASLAQMTRTMRSEEEALRRKIDEVETATVELKQTQRSLVRSERLASVGRLAAGLAHEVGNPISALLGLQELLLDEDLEPEQRHDFVRRMRKETERIDRVLQDLLAFARPERPTQSRHVATRCSVTEAIEDVLSLLRPQKDLANVQFDSEIATTSNEVAMSHQELVQVLLNLVMNAADASNKQGPVRVSVQQGASGGWVLLAVEDEGPGIPPELAESVFEPFVSTKEVGQGTGLGLAVARGLVEAAGGQLRLDQSYEGGARFVVELPIASTTEGAAGDDAPKADASEDDASEQGVPDPARSPDAAPTS